MISPARTLGPGFFMQLPSQSPRAAVGAFVNRASKCYSPYKRPALNICPPKKAP